MRLTKKFHERKKIKEDAAVDKFVQKLLKVNMPNKVVQENYCTALAFFYSL